MTRITPSDRLLAIVREQLRSIGRQGSKSAQGTTAAGPLRRVRALTARGAVPDRALRRAIVHGVLAEAHGETLIADPAFHAIVERVGDMLIATPEGCALIDAVIRQFQAPPR